MKEVTFTVKRWQNDSGEIITDVIIESDCTKGSTYDVYFAEDVETVVADFKDLV